MNRRIQPSKFAIFTDWELRVLSEALSHAEQRALGNTARPHLLLIRRMSRQVRNEYQHRLVWTNLGRKQKESS